MSYIVREDGGLDKTFDSIRDLLYDKDLKVIQILRSIDALCIQYSEAQTAELFKLYDQNFPRSDCLGSNGEEYKRLSPRETQISNKIASPKNSYEFSRQFRCGALRFPFLPPYTQGSRPEERETSFGFLEDVQWTVQNQHRGLACYVNQYGSDELSTTERPPFNLLDADSWWVCARSDLLTKPWPMIARIQSLLPSFCLCIPSDYEPLYSDSCLLFDEKRDRNTPGLSLRHSQNQHMVLRQPLDHSMQSSGLSLVSDSQHLALPPHDESMQKILLRLQTQARSILSNPSIASDPYIWLILTQAPFEDLTTPAKILAESWPSKFDEIRRSLSSNDHTAHPTCSPVEEITKRINTELPDLPIWNKKWTPLLLTDSKKTAEQMAAGMATSIDWSMISPFCHIPFSEFVRVKCGYPSIVIKDVTDGFISACRHLRCLAEDPKLRKVLEEAGKVNFATTCTNSI